MIISVPFGIRGDDAGVYQHEKFLVVSWNSVAVQHMTLDNRMLFGCLACRYITDETLEDTFVYRCYSYLNCFLN